MANDSKNPVVETVIWAATVGGFAGLIGLFVPISRSFFETNGFLGWILFASLLTLLPWIVRSLVKAGTRGKDKALQERWDAENLTLLREREAREDSALRAQWRRDVKLVRDWLQGWDLHGKFHIYLVEGVIFAHLPLWFARELDERVEMWRRDPRELTQPSLEAQWEAFRAAATDFHDKLNEHMWMEPRTKAEREAGFEQFMQIPPEWKTRDHARYQGALNELQESRSSLEHCMASLLGTLHSSHVDETVLN